MSPLRSAKTDRRRSGSNGHGPDTGAASTMGPPRDRQDSRVAEVSDQQLVTDAQAGDDGAFEELVRRHADRLHAVVRRLVDSNHEAEEVTQEAFLRAWRGIARFKGRGVLDLSLPYRRQRGPSPTSAQAWAPARDLARGPGRRAAGRETWAGRRRRAPRSPRGSGAFDQRSAPRPPRPARPSRHRRTYDRRVGRRDGAQRSGLQKPAAPGPPCGAQRDRELPSQRP